MTLLCIAYIVKTRVQSRATPVFAYVLDATSLLLTTQLLRHRNVPQLYRTPIGDTDGLTSVPCDR